MRIRIEKIAEAPGGLPANDRKLHIDGQDQDENVSLPVEYTIEGELMGIISVGNSVVVNRDTRNGVKMPGIFTTSTVQDIGYKSFTTRNSVYNFTILEK
jgi:hypothetical protein